LYPTHDPPDSHGNGNATGMQREIIQPVSSPSFTSFLFYIWWDIDSKIGSCLADLALNTNTRGSRIKPPRNMDVRLKVALMQEMGLYPLKNPVKSVPIPCSWRPTMLICTHTHTHTHRFSYFRYPQGRSCAVYRLFSSQWMHTTTSGQFGCSAI